MDRTLSFRPEVRQRVPAVVHVDGSGRLQSVRRDLNPDFHALLSVFFELTGVPVLLNTSLNVMGKPIVDSVEDALGVFFLSGVDALVIGDVLIRKDGLPGVSHRRNPDQGGSP
jgi:carbamoyltransferase